MTLMLVTRQEDILGVKVLKKKIMKVYEKQVKRINENYKVEK